MNKTDLQQESMENLANCSWFAKEKPSKNLLIIQHLRTVHIRTYDRTYPFAKVFANRFRFGNSLNVH